MSGLKERRHFLRRHLQADVIRFQSKQNSIVVDPVLNENNVGQFYAQLCTEADETDEQHMEFVEHLYTNDTIQISNIDKVDSGVENGTLVIYENKVDYGRILPDFNIIKEITGLEEKMDLNLHVEDANALIHPNSKITKADFAEAFNELCQQSKGTSEKDRNLLGCLIHITFGDFCNLPFEAKRTADEMNKMTTMVRKMNKQILVMMKMKKKIPDQVLKTFWRIPQLMSPEDSLDFLHLINVKMTVRFFWGETVGYFIV